jgi:hypothetical protein
VRGNPYLAAARMLTLRFFPIDPDDRVVMNDGLQLMMERGGKP